MTSNNDSGTDGKTVHHDTGNKGSACTVRVGSRSLPVCPLVIVCLGLLNAILIVAAIVIGFYCGNISDASAALENTAGPLIIEARHLQTMQTEANAALQEARQELEKALRSHRQVKVQLEQNKTLSDSLQAQLETLQVERTILQADTSKIRDSCGRCQPEWVLINTSCYFYSKSASNPGKNWHDSRADCISRGANLTVIDSLEEQLNLFEFLPKLQPSQLPWWRSENGFWIGLSDIDREGTWLWLNNVPQLGEGYWVRGEPNDFGHGGEDCAGFINVIKPRETWFDADCLQHKDWLCEMEPN